MICATEGIIEARARSLRVKCIYVLANEISVNDFFEGHIVLIC